MVNIVVCKVERARPKWHFVVLAFLGSHLLPLFLPFLKKLDWYNDLMGSS